MAPSTQKNYRIPEERLEGLNLLVEHGLFDEAEMVRRLLPSKAFAEAVLQANRRRHRQSGNPFARPFDSGQIWSDYVAWRFMEIMDDHPVSLDKHIGLVYSHEAMALLFVAFCKAEQQVDGYDFAPADEPPLPDGRQPQWIVKDGAAILVGHH